MEQKVLLLLSLVIGFYSLSAAEHGYLSYQHVNNGSNSVQTYDDVIITLSEGDYITFSAGNSPNGYSPRIEVELPDESTILYEASEIGAHRNNYTVPVPQKIVGPCILRLCSYGQVQSGPVYIAYELTRASDNTSSLPSNSVVIPTDATGDVEIILESSEDLVNWTSADPGTYGSSTDKRFFRVRAVAQ